MKVVTYRSSWLKIFIDFSYLKMMISILGYLRYENTPKNMVYTQRIVNHSLSWVWIFWFGTPDRQNIKFLVKSTLPSEIVRTVLVIAIENHCWLWTTISRWKKEIGAFLKIQLKSLWNSTSSDAQEIFFWLSENNKAREELEKKFKIFLNSLPQLQLFAWPTKIFSKIWKF